MTKSSVIAFLEKTLQYQNTFPDGLSIVEDVQLSRSREVVISTKGLDLDGVYIFQEKGDGVYEPRKCHTLPLIYTKIKAYHDTAVKFIQPDCVRHDPVTVELSEENSFIDWVKEIFNNVDLAPYDLQLKLVPKDKGRYVKAQLTSKEIEHIVSPEPCFLAYVFGNSRNYNLLDIGEMWDAGVISIADMRELLCDTSQRIDVHAWARHNLSADEIKQNQENYETRKRTKAFDSIIKEHNPKIKSNIKGVGKSKRK